jgi:hypothetical protein
MGWDRSKSHSPMVLTDQRIASLLGEPKQTVDPTALLHELKPEPVGASRLAMRTVPAADDGIFALRVRQGLLNPYDFSIILSYAPARGAEVNLRRHNGPSHAHRNPIEGTSFRGVCHIHEATERYQLRGNKAEHYAEPTQRFHDVATALACMLVDANFEPPAQSPFPGL